ncbi:MAG: NADH-quinone oxidoreductase subunit J [Anaerolineae bacterium]|nr:NADH-quinone oxidoreductase subunit J [Anaerolineae bacterium]
MSAELVLFIVVAAVAIFSAAFMLVSRNAVHSALLLVLNFLCVAFFYLMLNAPFLAAIQITVYAGAIMVLFMFVIMLLGAEKLGGTGGRYSWMSPAAVGLTTLILIIAFLAVTRSSIGALTPQPKSPEVGFVHAVAGVSDVDIYLDEMLVAKDVKYGEPVDLTTVSAGEYTVLAFPSCTEADAANCADPLESGAAPLFASPLTLEPETHTEVVIAGTPQTGLQVVAVPLDLSEVADDNQLRLLFVNVLPGDPVTIQELDPAKPSEPLNLASDLGFGAITDPVTVERGTYNLAFQRGSSRLLTLRELPLRGKTLELIVLAPEAVETTSGTELRARSIRFEDPPLRTAEAFGSPQAIGLSMLSTFMLPFELVSLLLLAAMVGAIILTREEVIKRSRERIVVSPAIRKMNKALSGAVIPGAARRESDTSGAAGAESSAD